MSTRGTYTVAKKTKQTSRNVGDLPSMRIQTKLAGIFGI